MDAAHGGRSAGRIFELGYFLVESTDVQAWRRFGEQVLGAMTSNQANGGLYLKFDERVHRIAVIPGSRDGLIACGWAVAGERALDETRASIQTAGIQVRIGTEDERRIRKVRDFISFCDPAGNPHEIFWGPEADFIRFASPVGVPRFVTGSLGAGHLVLPAGNAFDQTTRFWHEVVGLHLSNTRRIKVGPTEERRVNFYHCHTGRHHSVAFAELPAPHGCRHIMVEVDSIDEVGRAFDRAVKNGVTIDRGLGRHTNDGMTSFYMHSPGGFALEYGTGGMVLDWRTHMPVEDIRGSHWGHARAA